MADNLNHNTVQGALINIEFIREVGPFQWFYRTAIRQFYKRVLKRNQKMLLPGGEWITLPIDSHFATEAFITHADTDWGSEKLLASLVSGHGVFLDIGANIGYYSLYFAPRSSAVYSFEPDPRALVNLRPNVSHSSKIEIIPYAVGATVGKAYFVAEQQTEFSHLSMTGGESANQIEVDIVTVDSFVASRSLQVEAIKIDAGGHDLEVVQGALDTLRQQQPIVLMEAHPTPELFAIGRDAGYRVFAFVRDPRTRKRSFAELLPGEPAPGSLKMLFFTPERLAKRIAAEASRYM